VKKGVQAMSALGPKADICSAKRHVRFTPQDSPSRHFAELSVPSVCQDCAEVFLCPPGNSDLKNMWVHVRELSSARQAIVQLCPQVPRPFNNSWKVIMVGRQRASFDPETLSLLRQTLDDAWESLTPVQRAMTSRTLLAERILKSAAKGERDPERLRDEALMLFAA
jgi:hypothetical protein